MQDKFDIVVIIIFIIVALLIIFAPKVNGQEIINISKVILPKGVIRYDPDSSITIYRYTSIEDSIRIGREMYQEYLIEKARKDSIDKANRIGVQDVFSYPFKLLWKVASNKHVQKYGSTVLWIASRHYDAKADACVFAGQSQVYGADKNKWHAYKNTALIFSMASMGLKGIGIGQGNLDAKRTAKRFLFGECPVSWLVWQDTYRYTRRGKHFDYEPRHNEHRFMIPFFGKDRYLKLKKKEGYLFADVFVLNVGLSNLIKYR